MAMTGLNINVVIEDKGEYRRFLNNCVNKVTDAMVESLNYAGGAVRDEMRSQVPKKWNVKKSQMGNKDFKVKLQKGKYNNGGAETRVYFGGGRAELFKLETSPTKVMAGVTTGGVTTKIWGESVNLGHAFVQKADGKGSKKHVFVRPKLDNVKSLTGMLKKKGIHAKIKYLFGKQKTHFNDKKGVRHNIKAGRGGYAQRYPIVTLSTKYVAKHRVIEKTDMYAKICDIAQVKFDEKFTYLCKFWLFTDGK